MAAALVASLCGAAGVEARKDVPTLVGPKGHAIRGKWHRWLTQSRMPLVQGRVRIVFGGCPGAAGFSGCVFSRRPRTLYIRRNARVPKGVLYHELGHTFDLTLLHPRDRKRIRRVLHVKRGWFAGSPPPAELFAEAYADCARFGLRRPTMKRLGWTVSEYRYRPSRSQYRTICKVIQRAGAPKRRRTSQPQPPPNAPPVFVEPKPQPQPQPQNPSPLPPLPLPPILPLG